MDIPHGFFPSRFYLTDIIYSNFKIKMTGF